MLEQTMLLVGRSFDSTHTDEEDFLIPHSYMRLRKKRKPSSAQNCGFISESGRLSIASIEYMKNNTAVCIVNLIFYSRINCSSFVVSKNSFMVFPSPDGKYNPVFSRCSAMGKWVD